MGPDLLQTAERSHGATLTWCMLQDITDMRRPCYVIALWKDKIKEKKSPWAISNADNMLFAKKKKKKAPSPQLLHISQSLDVFIAVCCTIFADNQKAENFI